MKDVEALVLKQPFTNGSQAIGSLAAPRYLEKFLTALKPAKGSSMKSDASFILSVTNEEACPLIVKHEVVNIDVPL